MVDAEDQCSTIRTKKKGGAESSPFFTADAVKVSERVAHPFGWCNFHRLPNK